MLRTTLGARSRHCRTTRAANTCPTSLLTSPRHVASCAVILYAIGRSRMASRSAPIVLCRTPSQPCLPSQDCPLPFGARLWPPLCCPELPAHVCCAECNALRAMAWPEARCLAFPHLGMHCLRACAEGQAMWTRAAYGEVRLHWVSCRLQGLEVLQPDDQEGDHQ